MRVTAVKSHLSTKKQTIGNAQRMAVPQQANPGAMMYVKTTSGIIAIIAR